ncbi:MAG: LysR family transcriptional regulator [Bacteroidetes bacterium]|nr:LysR family transcriptional regulator [Bacteroidota bacterium]
MSDFRLKVFYTVAQRLSFTKAAQELYLSQPAVTRHIRELEQQYQTSLLDRSGSRVSLTPAGQSLLAYTTRIMELYSEAAFEISALQHQASGTLTIGASTTFAQYILPQMLARFRTRYRNVKVSVYAENTEHIEQALQGKKIDIGIIEGKTKNKAFRYTPLIRDEIVLVAASRNKLAKKGTLRLIDLHTVPLVLREPGSGSLEVVTHALRKAGLRLSALQTPVRMNSSEGIKSYLLQSDAMAFLSIHAVLRELERDELTVVDVKGLNIDRQFHLIHPHGGPDRLAGLFQQFVLGYNFRL